MGEMRGEGPYATIDIGTNTVLLVIAKPPHPNPLPQGERGVKVLRDEARITRLGEGVHCQPFFLPEAEERTLKVLQEYRKIADSFQVQGIAAVGTAAFRKAKNAADFVDRVKRELGIKIEIISGNEEARLSFLSVKKDFGHLEDRKNRGTLFALDIGGGSTEIISKEGGVSLDLGAVTLTERIVKQDPPSKEEIEQLVEAIDAQTSPPTPLLTKERGVAARRRREVTLIALAGTVTTLSAIQQKLAVWDGTRVQGSKLTLSDLNRMIDLFRRTTHEERRAIVGMVHGREDTILAGTLILKAVMEKVGTDEVIVSDRGLRYGLFYERFDKAVD